MSTTPGGRSTRFENVWLVIRLVIDRVDCSSRMFCVSGSENGPVPRNVSSSGSMLAPEPPQNAP